MVNVIRKPFVIPAIACALVIVWVLAWSLDPIVNGHRSYVVYYLGFLIVSLLALVWAFWKPENEGRLWLSVPGAVVLIIAAIGAWLLAPFSATEVALNAMDSGPSVEVTSTGSSITLTPVGETSELGFVFQPGARVDSRAYAHILRPLAEAGHPVVIVKQPLGIGFFANGFASTWVEEHPETDWAVGGHSLGATVAAGNAAEDPALRDLVLWASYPATDISDTPDLAVVSVFGTEDALTEPMEVEETASDLPEGTTFVPVEGAVHSSFGDYGEQPGDGEPTVPRSAAQEQIVAATLAFLIR
ncbi:MAG: alpha/beta hydrolase [Acidimicrobiia bacterium]